MANLEKRTQVLLVGKLQSIKQILEDGPFPEDESIKELYVELYRKVRTLMLKQWDYTDRFFD